MRPRERDRGEGQIFQARYRDKAGDVRTCETWTIRYYVGGKHRKEGGFRSRQEAQKVLTTRLAKIHTGEVPAPSKATFEDLVDLVRTDYRIHKRRSLRRVDLSVSHLKKAFRGLPARAIDEQALAKYTDARLDEEASNASVNRELQVLRRGFRLAKKQKVLAVVPEFTLLEEHNARKGFFEAEDLARLLPHLPEYVRPVVRVAYITGWRTRSEILPLTWDRVDLREGVIRLEPNTTKNDDGREFYFTPELRAILEERRAAVDRLQRETGRVIRHVFTLPSGEPFAKFERSWRTACRAAELVGSIPHDFRRTAVRNLERAGVSRSVAKKITGHRTDTVYNRYAVTPSAKLAALGSSSGPVTPPAARITSIHAGRKATRGGS